MNFTQHYDLKNGTIECNLCQRQVRHGARQYNTEHFILTTCTRCRKELRKYLDFETQK